MCAMHYNCLRFPEQADGGIDYSYFAADCFHYSKKGQEETAQALWNNMVREETRMATTITRTTLITTTIVATLTSD